MSAGPESDPGSGTAPGPTTLDARIGRDAPADGGWSPLVLRPGEEHTGEAPDRHGRTLATLIHLSDLHLCDAESPARQEHLDHHGDPGAPYAGRLGTIGTYRPQEILTVQVAAAALRAVHRLDRGPLAGSAPDAVVVTGDVTDNAQRNELSWYEALMTGRTIAPRSGDRTRSSWVGSRDAGGWWRQYWHPDGSPAGERDDLPTELYGYPLLPGLVEAARRDVRSPGSPLPWLSVHGNHDALLQGTLQPTDALRSLAVGTARIVDLAPDQNPLAVLEGIAASGPARALDDADAPRVPVVADRGRALVTEQEFRAVGAEHTAPDCSADPADSPDSGAHTPVGDRHGNAWARDVGEVRLIALDTVDPHGGWQGSLDADQLAWLSAQLDAAAGRYVVIASHHPSWTLTNAWAPPGAPPRVLAGEVLALLLRHPGVVAWLAGHVHAHSALWHRAPGARGDAGGGLWEVTTASLIDWPQQLRVLELVREPGGTLALAATVVDHAGPTRWDPEDLDDPDALAAISRTLAVNDYRARHDPSRLLLAAGRPGDRNAVWRLPDPHA